MTSALPEYQRKNFTWDAATDATILRMAAEGFSRSQIGNAIGRTRNAVIGRLHRLDQSALGKGKPKPMRGKTVKPRAPSATSAKSKPKPMRGKTVKPRTPSAPSAKSERNRGLGRALRSLVFSGKPVDFETPVMGSVTFMDLRLGHCRWPFGDPKTPGLRFCGAYTEGSFCPHHAAMAYTPRRAA